MRALTEYRRFQLLKDIAPLNCLAAIHSIRWGFIIMAKNKKSFVLYCDQQGVFNKLPDEIAGKLIKHIFSFVNDENPICDDLLIEIAFEPIKQSLKRDLKKYEHYIDKQAINGAKGGRPRKEEETQKTQPFFLKPKKPDSVSDSVSDNDIIKEIIKRKVFSKPTIQEVQTYMTELKMPDLADRFISYYDSNGWKVGKNPMKDWKAAIRTWRSTNNEKQIQTQPMYKKL